MILAFADCQLDRSRRELRRSGQAIRVEPQVFDLIEMLILNRSRVVSKDELFAAVWQGRIVSETTLSSRLSAARRAIGDSGEDQKLIITLPRRGFRFAGDVRELAAPSPRASEAPGSHAGAKGLAQSVRFCTTSDGVLLAVATTGRGKTVAKASNWMNHVADDLHNPLWSWLLARAGEGRRLVRYDGRGIGLSDRDVADISFDKFVLDLETVIDSLGVEKVSLVGMSMGAATAIAYAAKHPERIDKLVLHGAFAIGRRRRNSSSDLEQADLFLALMRQGWGKPDPTFMKVFACIYFPHANEELLRWFVELQRRNASPETAMRIRTACDDIDVLDLLPLVRAPVLVTHSRDDHVVPIGNGRTVASLLPNARFLVFDSSNHMILSDEPEAVRLAGTVAEFLEHGLA